MSRFNTILIVATLLALAGAAQAQTNFSFQGKLKVAGGPASGPLNLEFRLFGVPNGGVQIGASELFNGFTGFDADGLFVVDLDFGGGAFTGGNRWVEVVVDGQVLAPRQSITAAPYAIYALNGGTNGWTDKGTLTHTMDDVGIGTIAPEGPLHVMEGSAGAVTAQANSSAVFERSGQNFVSILSPDNSERGILFGDPENLANGGIVYNSAAGADGMVFRTGGNLNRMMINNGGQVGIGTTSPVGGQLHVVAEPGRWGVRVEGDNQNSAIYATNSGTFGSQAIYGFNSATGASATGVQGVVAGSTPGADAAGVLGILSNVNTNNGYGVYGRHTGSGYGVYGQALSTTAGAGVFGRGWWGVYGVSNSTQGFGGVFAGSGFLGSGPSLLVWGDSTFGGGLKVGVGGGLTAPPNVKFQVDGGTDTNPVSGGYIVAGSLDGANISMDNNEIMARNNGAVSTLYLNNEGGDVRIGQNGVAPTVVYVPVITITGADVAEKFPVSGDRADAEPGTVMAIDPANPGTLRVAEGAYNPRVAGVVSGAGDLPAGAILGNLPGYEDAPPIALSGRVWVKCDAGARPISVGDMLTTSDTPGHAMSASDRDRAYGAVIGKAMTALEQGETGLVLVLINLQ